MECKNSAKNGLLTSEVPTWVRQFSFELHGSEKRALQLRDAAGLRDTTAVGKQYHDVASTLSFRQPQIAESCDHPFMNTMDEISYWIFTKRAPCLMDYDNTNKKQNEDIESKSKSVLSAVEVPSPKKKKKRKLSLLDDDSGSGEKQMHVYFDTCPNKKHAAVSSCKSDTLRSEIDFNIKAPSVQCKFKQTKPNKKSITVVHKKNKLVTSTPKVSQLRRSLRQAQQSSNNNSQVNGSFEVFNTSISHVDDHKQSALHKKTVTKKSSTELLAGGDQTTDNKKHMATNTFDKPNGQFEDLSDVSGFTANYIRSTKIQSTPRKLRCKNNRNLVKESQDITQESETMVVYVNKSNNIPNNVCSSDSVNVVNLVTTKRGKSTKVNRSTSLLKFIDLKPIKDEVTVKVDSPRKSKTKMNVSFQSRSSSSRYPKRHRNNLRRQDSPEKSFKNVLQTAKRKISKNSSDFNNSDRKENTEETTVSRTRSGRNIGLTLRQPGNSVLVLSNSSEHVSSMASMNVASVNVTSPGKEQPERKKKRATRPLRSKRMSDKHGSELVQRDSLRDKSGFTACFSDSDNDSEPLKQRKFFCV